MGNRLSKIYTRTGDDGTTAMADGKRLSKTEPVFEVMGDVDELNSHIGMAKYLADSENNERTQQIGLSDSLTIIQHLLFNLGGELAMPNMGYQGISKQHIDWLESQIDEMNRQLAPLKDFILPTGNPLMCQLHLARAVCRRSERHAIGLQNATNDGDCGIYKTSVQFLNRLSDWLFVASRFVGLELSSEQAKEVLWNQSILEQFTCNPA